jgi:ribosome maturation protein Sdo1
MANAKFAMLISNKTTISSFARSVARLIIESAMNIKGNAHTPTNMVQASLTKVQWQIVLKKAAKIRHPQR